MSILQKRGHFEMSKMIIKDFVPSSSHMKWSYALLLFFTNYRTIRLFEMPLHFQTKEEFHTYN